MLERALHVVDDRQEAHHELLRCTLALVQTLLGGAATVVVPVCLKADETIGGLGGLLLGLLDVLRHITELLLKLVALGAELLRVLDGLLLEHLVRCLHGGGAHRRVVFRIYVTGGRAGGRGCRGLLGCRRALGRGVLLVRLLDARLLLVCILDRHFHVTLLMRTRGSGLGGRPLDRFS